MIGNYTIYWNKITFLLACVAGVRKGRGRELGCETTRERGRRSGTHARKLLFSISHLLIKKNDTNMAAGFIVVVHRCGGHDVMWKRSRFVAYRPREDNARREENASSPDPFLPLRARRRDFSLRCKKPASATQAKPVYADVFPVVAKSNITFTVTFLVEKSKNRKYIWVRRLPNIVNKELNKLKQNSEVQCVH